MNTIRYTDRFLRVLQHKPVDKTPIWLMRQAGRYLPEYRRVRAQVKDFLTLCQTPELACEVTLQPLYRYPLDAAILFQDILTLPHAMGLPLQFIENEGPVFQESIRTLEDVQKLRIPDPEIDLPYLGQAIDLIVQELQSKVPLIGFCGSPWTVATYMVEGKVSKNFAKIRKMMVEEPEMLKVLLHKLSDASALYLQAQIRRGVSCVMIFDTWGGILPYWSFKEYSLYFMQRMIELLNTSVPIILFTKNASPWYADLAQTKATCLGADWTMPLSQIRKCVGPTMVLQGNLDPFILYGSDQTIQNEVQTILEDYGPHPGHIFNLGHGMLPDLDPEKVQVLVESVHNFSSTFHQTIAQSQVA